MDEHLACEVDHVIACEGRRPSARASMGLSLQRCVYPCLGSSPARRAAKRLYHWACDHGLLSGSQPTSSSLMGHADRFLRLASAAQSRAGLHQLRKWRQNLQKRVDEGEHLQARLRAAGLSWVEPAPWATPMYLRFPVWVADKTAVLTAADRAGLDIAGWYLSPAHPIRGEALHALGYASGQCPSAEDAFARVVTLPTQPALGPRRLEQAIRIVAGARTGQENTGD